MAKFTDTSQPPINDDGVLEYLRGDGAKVELKITPPALATTPPKTQTCKSGACDTTGECKSGKCSPKGAKSPNTKRTSASVVIPTGMPIKINPTAKVNVRDPNKQVATTARPGQSPDFSDDRILDHPSVGGKITTFILFYGGEEFHELHRKCLTTFLATTPADRIDLRVASNALNKKSLAMLDEYQEKGFITKHYRHEENAYKYPVMREMFYDPEHPITTKWVLWFDDDSICDVQPSWLNMLGRHISQHHKDKAKEAHMIGASYIWTPNKKQKEAIATRPWYNGRPWRTAQGKPSPNGTKILFATGGFWAITHEAIVAADIPDLGTGLTHTGGDWQIGEQLYQAGYTMRQFNGKKQFVRTSSVDRRGVTMPTIDKTGDMENTEETAPVIATAEKTDKIIVPPPLPAAIRPTAIRAPIKMATNSGQPKLRKL